MASPRHVPAAAAGSGNRENISENARPALHTDATFSPKGKKKPAGFNLRKSIAWNPAFFTEEGVLDTSELSVLTGSQPLANGSPSSGVNGKFSPLCRSNTHVLNQIADKSVSAKYSRAENQGRRLFSSAKTPQRDERKKTAEIQRNSARSFQKRIPQVPAGSTQKKVPDSTSTVLMSRIPKMPLSSLPMAPRSTTPTTAGSKSNKKLAPVTTEHIHRVPRLPRKSKIDSRPSMEADVVPAVASIHEETSGSVKFKNPQVNPSNFGGTTPTIAKPSALRMPSPSAGFFTQEKAQTSHDAAAERNAGRFSARITSSLVKPPRYKLPEDLKAGLHLSNVLSTNCTTASTLDSLPVITDNNTNTLVTSEKRSLSKIISTYSTKSRDASSEEKPDVSCLLAGNGATTQHLSLEKNDGARNNVSTVYNDTLCVEGRDIRKEIEPAENSLPLKATCFSTIEAIEDSCSLKTTCSSTRTTAGSKLAPSCISSDSNDLTYQSKRDSGATAATDLESCVGERAIPVSSCEGESYTLDIDSFQNSDSCDHHNTECATSMDSMEYTLCADQMPPSGSSSDGNPDLVDDRKYIRNDSLYDAGESALTGEPHTDGGTELETNNASVVTEVPQGESALTGEPNTDGGTELETNKASVVTEDHLLHVGCEQNRSFKRTKCSPVKQVAPMTCVERQNVLSTELNMEDKMVVGSNKLLPQDGASHIEKDKEVDRSRTNTILRDHLKNLVPFTEEWLAVMEACGQEVLEQKSGAVQNSPPDKTAPEPSPWSPVKRKAQDVGPFDCTKYSKSVRTSVSP